MVCPLGAISFLEVFVYIVCTPSACKPVLTGLLVVDDFEFFAGTAAIVPASLVPLAVVSWTHQRGILNKSVLRIRIRDPVPFGPLDPGSGMGEKIRDPDPGCTTRLIFPRT
jgi:hypothetical protein